MRSLLHTLRSSFRAQFVVQQSGNRFIEPRSMSGKSEIMNGPGGLLEDDWKPIHLSVGDVINLTVTLTSGQVFGWKKDLNGEGTWTGVLGNDVVVLREGTPSETSALLPHNSFQYQSLTRPSPCGDSDDDDAGRQHDMHIDKSLRYYFRLDVHLPTLYNKWSIPHTPSHDSKPSVTISPKPLVDAKGESSDPSVLSDVNSTEASDINEWFKSLIPHAPGLRLLRQEPFQCMMSFVCSQNNNIKRIEQLVDKLNSTFGKLLNENQNGSSDPCYYAFPTPERLSEATEEEFRALGFGYRAKWIPKIAQMVCGDGPSGPTLASAVTSTSSPSPADVPPPYMTPKSEWLTSLNSENVSRLEAQRALLVLPGIGRKVADCIALFSLDKNDAVPVDTHVWKMAARFLYGNPDGGGTNPTPPSSPATTSPSPSKSPSTPERLPKSLTDRVYAQVGTFFTDKFGDDAGWAHCILFYAQVNSKAKTQPSPKPKRKITNKKKEEVSKEKKKARVVTRNDLLHSN
eukprot:TRINITY_DN11717_c0_g1_i1.p1 TRINITY_DN11717_c0_g1~~TRINITY_DN11717_c0_g1_i1.p1  ORF type:complete len:514 (+),score=71.60 TRINITY_DN11717_c0_g1_i1:187-1728(+)